MPYDTNYRLRAMIEDNAGALLTFDSADILPRPGESELQRIVRVYGIDYALDLLEQGAIEDGFVSTIQIFGKTAKTGSWHDPLFVKGNDAIKKQMLSSDLPATRERWNELGRSIHNVVLV